MTELLVRLFVKDYKNVEDSNVRTAYGVLAGVVGIVCNIILFAAKGLIGVFSGSIAIVADALNNLTDAASSIISLVGAKLANRPADEEHPFGHGRYEYIAAFIVAFLVIEVGLSCAKNAFGKILEPTQITVSMVSVIVLLISVFGKLWLGLFNRKLGNRIHSSVMKATAADAMGDMLTTGATIVSMGIYYYFNVNLDGVVGLIVALIVVWAGVNIVREALKPLLGEKADPEMARKIKNMVESYDGVYGSHDLIIHNYGPTNSMATIHAEVSNSADIELSHELIDRIEREVTKATGVFLVIHMDPIEVNDKQVLQYKSVVEAILKDIDASLNSHDFRMVNGENQINLIFDVVVPYTYNESQKKELLQQIAKKMQAFDERCQCVITVENSYIGE